MGSSVRSIALVADGEFVPILFWASRQSAPFGSCGTSGVSASHGVWSRVITVALCLFFWVTLFLVDS